MDGESRELSDAGVGRWRPGGDNAQGQDLAPGVGAGGDAVVDGRAEELLETVVGLEVERGRLVVADQQSKGAATAKVYTYEIQARSEVWITHTTRVESAPGEPPKVKNLFRGHSAETALRRTKKKTCARELHAEALAVCERGLARERAATRA